MTTLTMLIDQSPRLASFIELLETPFGWVQLGLVVTWFYIALSIARRVYRRFFDQAPENFDRLGPYVLFRMTLPLTASALCFLSVLAAWWFNYPYHIFLLGGSTLFWLAMIRLTAALIRHALPQGKFERSTEHFMAMLLWLTYLSYLLGLDEFTTDWLQSIRFHVGKSELNLLIIGSGLLWASVILLAAMWLSRAIDRRVMHLSHLDMSLRIVLSKVARTLLIVIAVLIALPIVGIDLTVLSVFGGALGVGLGFGLQKIASNYVSGFIILIDRSVRIGDRVTIGDRTGELTQITSRYVVLRSSDGTEALIPNENLIANTVINQSYSNTDIWQSLTVGVSYQSDLERVQAILIEAALSVERVLKTPAPNAFVTEFADSSVNFVVGYWIGDPQNGLLSPRSEINLEIWRRFKAEGIEIPFPQREVKLIGPQPVPEG